MKKMRINRRGFTLVEIIIVVGIVVILSSAAFLGVAVTIDRANNAQNKLRDEGGANFEHEAWIKVNSINLGAADFYELQTHTPEGNTPTPADDTTDDNGDDGVIGDDNGVVDDTTGDKVEDKTTVVEDKTTVVEDKDPVVTTSTNPHIANTYKSTNNTNAQGSSVNNSNPNITHDYTEKWYWTAERGSWSERTYTNTKIESSGQITASNNKIEEVIITVPSGTTEVRVDSWKYTVVKVDDTHYRIFYDAPSRNNDGDNNYIWNPPETSISYRYSEYYSDPSINSSAGVVVSEYSTSK
jgi:prepilin-type N-terminal cleavage/methylation domain-containing protein